ncbi:hypothetical protein INR49_004414 [Caranx melampygus]|nr:hypothetical protein INR49_004414 [Caranx melampygus]
MRGIFASCALAAVLLAVTWADHHGHHHHPDHSHDHSHEGEHSCHKLSHPNIDFGFALYKNLNARTPAGKNIFFSPLGISSALSMLSTGARGETFRQLFSSLGYSGLDQAQVNEAYQHLFHLLGHSQKDQQMDVGNVIAVRSGFTPLEQFMKDIKGFYGGSSFDVDFSKPEEAAAEINRFIAGKTHDKIKDMVKDLDPAMALVLINFVYFRGQWERPFDGNQTHKADFHVDETTKVQVDMMRRMGRYDFYQDSDNHTTVIMLPYKGNTSMLIVLPDEGKMAEVEGYINKDYIKHWHDSLFRSSVDLFLPKFSISAAASLDETFKEMGITNAYSDDADFSGMSAEIKLKLSKASHQAVLSVDETGTEAAAGTTLEVMPMSLPETMTLNRPFLVFICEHSARASSSWARSTTPQPCKMTALENNINKNSIKHWQDSVSSVYLTLSMPKFSISFETSLDDTLKEMGITNGFDKDTDFSGVSEMSKLKLSKVTHKATLSVTEAGTEAAAPSFIKDMNRGLPGRTGMISQPFLVFILENSTGNILFMGKINNPTAM